MTENKIALIDLKPSTFERRWVDSRGYREAAIDRPSAPTRIFVSFGETVSEHLANRRNRPYTQLKPIIAAELDKLGVKYTKIRWNRYAGCQMCPCSGGFIIEGNYGKDFWAEFQIEEVA